MRLLPLLAVSLAATASSPPTLQSRVIKCSEPTASTECVPAPRRHTSVAIVRRMQRPRPDELPLPPPASANAGASASSNIAQDNSSTSFTPQTIPSPPAWVLTLEDLVTAICRIFITILTLFNVNITWRIRGECQRSPAYDTKTHVSNSEPRSSTSWVKACMGRCEVGVCLEQGFCWVGGFCLFWLDSEEIKG